MIHRSIEEIPEDTCDDTQINKKRFQKIHVMIHRSIRRDSRRYM
jgi:hypothetical protein